MTPATQNTATPAQDVPQPSTPHVKSGFGGRPKGALNKRTRLGISSFSTVVSDSSYVKRAWERATKVKVIYYTITEEVIDPKTQKKKKIKLRKPYVLEPSEKIFIWLGEMKFGKPLQRVKDVTHQDENLLVIANAVADTIENPVVDDTTEPAPKGDADVDNATA